MATKLQIEHNKLLMKEGIKLCRKCGISKPFSEFYKRSNRPCGISNSCNKCSKRRVTHKRLKEFYNITEEDWNIIFNIQEGKCAICGIHQIDSHLRFHVDHDHKTGEVRGLLCFRCNIGIGALNDDTQTLEKAIKYLKRK